VVDQEYWEIEPQLLEDAGLAHELRPLSSGPKPETTDDAVLGGRLRLKQKKKSHRVGSRRHSAGGGDKRAAGGRVVEFARAFGAAGLALAVRLSDVAVTLLEIDPNCRISRRRTSCGRPSISGLAPSRWMSQRRPTISQPKASDPAQRSCPDEPRSTIRRGRMSRPIRPAQRVARGGRQHTWPIGQPRQRWVLHSAGTLDT